MDDERFNENKRCLDWIFQWKKQVVDTHNMKPKERNKRFLSDKTFFDVSSKILGFQTFCQTMFTKLPGCHITASTTNQNAFKTFFGNQRAQNGQADNPTVLQTGSLL